MNEEITKRHGNYVPIEDRFWTKVKMGDPNECWDWLAWKSKNYEGYTSILPYGRVSYKGTAKVASRVAWELTNGPIPEGLKVLHKCDRPQCCNPNHLFLGTLSENSMDAIRKGRMKIRMGEKVNTAKLTSDQVISIRAEYTGRHGQITELAKKYKISVASMSKILLRQNWKHIP